MARKSMCSNETKVFFVSKRTKAIRYGAFVERKNLRMIVFPKTSSILYERAICDCPELDTLIFKSQELDGERVSHWDIIWQNVITCCPKLHDIYLYAENPEKVSFAIFEDLENLGDITLHVPCFCAHKYLEYGVEYFNWVGNKKIVKSWRKFKRIEEFDPIDFIEEQ